MNSQSRTVDLAIAGGTVVSDGWQRKATVLINNGVVCALTDASDNSDLSHARQVIDAEGKFVMPGAVDAHCHVADRHGEFITRDGYELASRAALAGGTTTLIDFAIPSPGENPATALAAKLEIGRESRCDYSLHGCIGSPDTDVEEAVREFVAAGIRTVKLFTTYRGDVLVDTETIERVMTSLQRVAGLAYVHAEANDVVEAAQARASLEGYIDASHISRSRPISAEEKAVAEVLGAAERTGSPVYFVHQSTASAVDLVVAARQRGVRAFSETCPHYLALSATSYEGAHPERFVCCPPLHPQSVVEALGKRLEMGFIDTIGSDHCCYDSKQKLTHADDVRAMPNGLPGVETRLMVIWNMFVRAGRLSPARFVDLVAANPARLNGLYPRKGSLAPGSDADIVLFDPLATRTLQAKELHMATDYSPYEGHVVKGLPTTVTSRGHIVLDDGNYVDPGPVGQFVESRPIAFA